MHTRERESPVALTVSRRNIMNICKQGPPFALLFGAKGETKDQSKNKTILSLLSWPYTWKRGLFLRVGSLLSFQTIWVFYCYLFRKVPRKTGQYHVSSLAHFFLWVGSHENHACTCSHVTVSRDSTSCQDTSLAILYYRTPWWLEATPSIPNCKTFDFFGSKFDHSSYSKNLCKYSQI